MRRVSTWIAGLVLAVFLLGASVVPLTIPAFTRIVASKTSLAAEAGISQSRILEVAEQVRHFVVDTDAPMLPASVDGRAGFDAAAVSHLVDVRNVLAAARIASGLLALVLAAGLAYEVSRKRVDRIADALVAGAICSFSLVILCVLAATMNFEAFFSAFHGLFFSAGTWTFSYDSLLIQTFPEPFWVTAGAVWGGLVLLGSGLFLLGAWALRRGSAGPDSSDAETPSRSRVSVKA
jgi:integral membrane protein (TIGR01906 family)